MPAVIGAQTTLAIRREATYGVAPTAPPNWSQLTYTQAALGASQGLIQEPFILGAGGNRDAGNPFLDGIETAGSITVPVNTNGVGVWFLMMFGSATVTDNSPNYTHRWNTGVFDQPSFAWQMDRPGLTQRYQLCTGVRVDTMEVDFTPTGAALMTLSLVGQSETLSTGSVAGTPTLVSGSNFSKAGGSLSISEDTGAAITAANIRISNNINAVRTIRADRKIEEAEPGIATAGGSLTARFQNTTLLNAAIAGTPMILTFRFDQGVNNWVEWHFANAYLSAPRAEVEGPQGLQLTFDWLAAFDPSQGLGRIRLRNQIPVYA